MDDGVWTTIVELQLRPGARLFVITGTSAAFTLLTDRWPTTSGNVFLAGTGSLSGGARQSNGARSGTSRFHCRRQRSWAMDTILIVPLVGILKLATPSLRATQLGAFSCGFCEFQICGWRRGGCISYCEYPQHLRSQART